MWGCSRCLRRPKLHQNLEKGCLQQRLTIDENIRRKIYVYTAKLNSVVDPNKYNIHYHLVLEMTLAKQTNTINYQRFPFWRTILPWKTRTNVRYLPKNCIEWDISVGSIFVDRAIDVQIEIDGDLRQVRSIHFDLFEKSTKGNFNLRRTTKRLLWNI